MNLNFLTRYSSKKILLPAVLLSLSFSANAVNYYWVGGSGNWSDLSHWATTSGGSTFQSIVPSPNDKVIFDAGSDFTSSNKTVNISTNAVCDSMIWSGSAIPATLVLNNPLQVSGSFQLQPGMTISGTGSILFNSSRPNESITTGNVDIPFPITFNGTGGWNLQDSLKMLNSSNGTLMFTNGNLNFNGQYANMYLFSSTGGNSTRTLNIANSTINIWGSSSSGWSYTGGVPLTAPNSVNSLITLNVASLSGMSSKVNDVYYNVVLTGAGTTTPSISNGRYNKVTFLGTNGRIFSNTTDTLILSSAKVYQFSGTATTINKYFSAKSPACSGLIEMYSITAGTQATITMAAGAVADVANARIRDLKIQGPAAPYAATSSIDLGNNTGWVFTAPAAHTYYWVGGTGNWNDATHWATSSNGLAGSGCVPTQMDNVIFDAGSGFTAGSKTVTIDGNAYCDSMTWSGSVTPATLVLNNPLEVSGSFQLQPGMATLGGGSILFNSSKLNESITTGNVLILSPITFNGTGGWNLQDSLKMLNSSNGTLMFTNGNLNFNGKYANMYLFSSTGGNSTRTLNIANSTINIWGSSSSGWSYTGGVPLTAPNSVNSLIILNVASLSGMSSKVNDVYYNVLLTGAGTTTPSISNGTYNKVTFLGTNGRIFSNTTDTLILSSAKVYQFSGTAITINKYFSAKSPACSGLIEMYSITAGTQATITMAAGAVADVANARIRDLKIQGPAVPYAATSSIDLGNNTGWAFTAPAAHTYYWVGASGNWNDATHWATSSNGLAGSGCVPTQMDNVIFDAGSGFTAGSKTVTIDGNAYCDSMTWSGSVTPATLVLNNPLEVSGSFQLQPGMATLGGGSILFNSSKLNESITTGNVLILSPITFNGTGGWNLQDSLKMLNSNNGTLMFTNGNLNFNGQYANMYLFSSSGGNGTRTLNIANSIIDILGSGSTGGLIQVAFR